MSKITSPGAGPRARGLGALAEIALTPDRQAVLDGAERQACGVEPWRRRKIREVHDLLALAQIAPPGRLSVQYVDAREALRAVAFLRVPVPTRPDPGGPLVVETVAALGLTYPPEVVSRPLPGFAFVQILEPSRVWHANVSERGGQRLCLGASLPACIPLKEIVLSSYGALALQSVQVDPGDPAGVMNPDAAVWWSQNLDRTPLTATPFLGTDEPKEKR